MRAKEDLTIRKWPIDSFLAVCDTKGIRSRLGGLCGAREMK